MADSICRQLNHFIQHKFIVVLSHYLVNTGDAIKDYGNVKVELYDIPDSFNSIVLGRDRFLDTTVENEHVNAVLTVFGPSRWIPRCVHLCGFALSQLVVPESPFFQQMSKAQLSKMWLWCRIRKWSFKRSADCFWTENPYISDRLRSLFKNRRVETVSNYYNQIFDQPDRWQRNVILPVFDGTTCLSVSSSASHKNFGIVVGIVRYLRRVHPGFKIRFVLTFKQEDWPMPDDVRNSVIYIGRVDVSDCPSLYEQADIMFMPSLLECFTATYPESMRMKVPIVTTDLDFARGLCGDAACYYSAIDPNAAAEAIYRVANDKEYARWLTENGKTRLLSFENYEQRAQKLVKLLEEIASS